MGSGGATTVHRDTRSAGHTCYPALYLDASSVPCAPHPAAVGGDVLCRKRRSIGSAYVFHPKRRANKVVPATTSLIAYFSWIAATNATRICPACSPQARRAC